MHTRVLSPNTPSVAAFIPIINTLSPEGPYICRHNTPTELSGTVVLPSHKPLAIGLFRVKMTTLEIRQVERNKRNKRNIWNRKWGDAWSNDKEFPSLFLARSLMGYHSFTCISRGKVLGITRLGRKPRGYCSNLINCVKEIFEEMSSFRDS